MTRNVGKEILNWLDRWLEANPVKDSANTETACYRSGVEYVRNTIRKEWGVSGRKRPE